MKEIFSFFLDRPAAMIFPLSITARNAFPTSSLVIIPRRPLYLVVAKPTLYRWEREALLMPAHSYVSLCGKLVTTRHPPAQKKSLQTKQARFKGSVIRRRRTTAATIEKDETCRKGYRRGRTMKRMRERDREREVLTTRGEARVEEART